MKGTFPFLIMLFSLGMISGAVIYLSRRFARYFGSRRIKPWAITFASLFIFALAGNFLLLNVKGFIGHILHILAAVLLGFLLVLILTVTAAHLVGMVARIKPRFMGLSVIISASLISVYGVVNAFDLKVTKIVIPLNDLKKPRRIMHLSDLHLGHFRGNGFLTEVVAITNQQRPDLVVITGDYLDARTALREESFLPLTQLQAPVYFVSGNHEVYAGLEAVKTYLGKAGVRVLENEILDMGDFQLIGLDYMSADESALNMHPTADKLTIKEVLKKMKIPPDKPAILLHHSPVGIQYAESSGVDLYLAGHTHGGQLFPLNLIGKLLFPFDLGLAEYRQMKIFVNGGAGTFGPPMRIGTRGEVVLITLIPASTTGRQ